MLLLPTVRGVIVPTGNIVLTQSAPSTPKHALLCDMTISSRVAAYLTKRHVDTMCWPFMT